MLELITQTIDKEGGRFMIAKMDEGGNVTEPWTAGLEWGREAEDSDMMGAAAYGVGRTPAESITRMLQDAGLANG
jgi:hypothetical protein